jgi:hypothetical protein
MGPGGFIVEFDVEKAFNTVGLRVEDVFAHVQKVVTKEFGTEFFTSLVNVFGTTDAPPSFAVLANSIWWLLALAPQELLRKLESHLFFVDNFWAFLPRAVLGTDPAAKALDVLNAVRTFLQELGVPYHDDRVSQSFEALGWAFGSSPQPWVGFKEDKHSLALAILAWLKRQQKLELKNLQRAKGFMRWLAAPFPALRSLITELQKAETMAGMSGKSQPMSPEIYSSLETLEEFLAAVPPNHKTFIHKGLISSARPDFVLRCDASGVEGLGWGCLNFGSFQLYRGIWTTREYDDSLREKTSSSTFLETLAFYKSLERALRSVAGKLILLETDSADLVAILAKGWSADPKTNQIVTKIVLLLAVRSCALRARQIRREWNMASDDLSKGKLEVLPSHLLAEVGSEQAKRFLGSLACSRE